MAMALHVATPGTAPEELPLYEHGTGQEKSRQDNSRDDQEPVKMACLRRMAMALALGSSLLVTFGLVSAALIRDCRRVEAEHVATVASGPDESFSALLRGASSGSLHQLLHEYLPKHFQHRQWPDDEAAIEAVHRAKAALATAVVRMAKRQAGNSTAPASSGPSSAESVTASVTTPIPTRTPPASSTGMATPAAPATPATPTIPPASVTPTSTLSTTTILSTSGTSTSASHTSAASFSSPRSSSTPTSYSPTFSAESSISGGPLSTASSSSTASVLTTQTYTTISGGSTFVVTATAYVDAGLPTTGPTPTRRTPTLQTNGAAPPGSHGYAALEVIAGAVLGGVLLL